MIKKTVSVMGRSMGEAFFVRRSFKGQKVLLNVEAGARCLPIYLDSEAPNFDAVNCWACLYSDRLIFRENEQIGTIEDLKDPE